MKKGFSRNNRLCTSNNRYSNVNERRVVVGVAVGVGVNKPAKKINVTCSNGMQITCNEHQLGCYNDSDYGACNPQVLTCHKPIPTGPVEMNIDNKISQGFAARVENDLYVRFPNYCGPGKPNDPNAIPMITQRQFQIQANQGLRTDSLPYNYSPPKPSTPPKPSSPINSRFRQTPPANHRLREAENRALRLLRQRTLMNRRRNNMN